MPATRNRDRGQVILERMLQAGFTTVRDAGGLDRVWPMPSDSVLSMGPARFRSVECFQPDGRARRLHAP